MIKLKVLKACLSKFFSHQISTNLSNFIECMVLNDPVQYLSHAHT